MNRLRLGAGLMLSILPAALAYPQREPDGKAIYEASCAACHATGVAGAPRAGDAHAWAARVSSGVKALYASAIKGKGAMPPKGGNASLTDAQVMAAVNHIVGLSAVTGAAPPAVPASAKPGDAARSPAAAANGGKGKLVYQATCAACHTSGLAGAPRLGDSAAWSSRANAGAQRVYASAIKGRGAMPPKGGNASLSDAEVRAAVDFMLVQAGLKPGPRASDARPPQSTVSASVVAATPVAMETAGANVAASLATAPGIEEAADPNAFNRLMVAPGRRNPPPSEDGIHDPASPGTALLQEPRLSFQSLPRANLGNYVNWVAALRGKQIRPRWDARDPNAEATTMDLTIVREVKGSMPDVVFPHKQHTEWLDCSNCHPAIFTPQKGANQISMASIMLGQKCGVCHGKIAFPISECRLCHARQKSSDARTAEAGNAGGGQQ